MDKKYPIPKLEDILDSLNGAEIFSSLDFKAGYHQIRMHPNDQAKTALTKVVTMWSQPSIREDQVHKVLGDASKPG